MNQAIRNLKPYLLKTLDGSISETELTEFVQLSRAIVQAHLEHMRSCMLNLCLHQGLTMTDLTYDCIADAFARDENNRLPQLENFVKSLRDNLDDLPEMEIFLAFKGFITRVADAQLARLYAQGDPAGAHIHRNIRDCARHSGIFNVERDFRGLVLRPVRVESVDELDPIPIDELEREFLSRALVRRRTVELLKTLCEILTEQSDYRRSLPLIDTVQLFKKVYRYEPGTPVEAERISLDSLTEFEVERLRSQVELALKEKILLTYFARGKVDRREAEAMFNAFHDMLGDWCSSGYSESSVQNYFVNHYPVDEDTYERSYRAKMEYLLKIAREEFAARLMREL
jgi:hypothetical protein